MNARDIPSRRTLSHISGGDDPLRALTAGIRATGNGRKVREVGVDGLHDRGGMLDPQRGVTRAEAAVILYRLFLLLNEVPPVAFELPEIEEPEDEVITPKREPEEADDEKPEKKSAAAIIIDLIFFFSVMSGVS